MLAPPWCVTVTVTVVTSFSDGAVMTAGGDDPDALLVILGFVMDRTSALARKFAEV